MDINKLLDEARESQCSDLHLTVNLPPVVRLAGELKKLDSYPTLSQSDIIKFCEQIADKDIMKHIEEKEDADFSYVSSKGFRHRVNVFHQRGYTAIAIRLLRDDIPTIEELGLPPIVKEFSNRPRGLVLVTGPTGSGKSTTLAAMINHINKTRKSHIITIEDPIEYVHKNECCMINQRELGSDVSDFKVALRSALREDPDVILVGEMRDYETINSAVTAAETGHLVLSTLHTTSAATTIDRIIDVFPAHQQNQIRAQLASVLVGVISQTLIPKVNSNSRVACLEILNVTDSISAMIRDNKVHMINSAIQTGKAYGMQLLDQELAKMVKNNIISKKDALQKCVSETELNRYTGSMML